MSNKTHYYETAHFFNYDYHYYNAVLRMLSLVSWSQIERRQLLMCAAGMVCLDFPSPFLFKKSDYPKR